MIGQASQDEKKQYHAGKAGDQTGREVFTRSFYIYSGGWSGVLRCKSDVMREKIAVAMERACANPNIGYDQWQRMTLWSQVKLKGFDPQLATTPCETDCTALTCVCLAYAGVPTKFLLIGNNSLTSYTMKKYLLNSGYFEWITKKEYLNSDKYLMRGDILLKEKHHAAVNLTNGSMVKTNPVVVENVTKKTDIMNNIYEGIDYSPVYNRDFYYNKYKDVDFDNAGVKTPELLLKHFVLFGMDEARIASIHFDVTKYRETMSDLNALYGAHWRRYYEHYLKCGKEEIEAGKRQKFM